MFNVTDGVEWFYTEHVQDYDLSQLSLAPSGDPTNSAGFLVQQGILSLRYLQDYPIWPPVTMSLNVNSNFYEGVATEYLFSKNINVRHYISMLIKVILLIRYQHMHHAFSVLFCYHPCLWMIN